MVGTPAYYSIFQLCWYTSLFNLSTWLGYHWQPIQSFNPVWIPADYSFNLVWTNLGWTLADFICVFSRAIAREWKNWAELHENGRTEQNHILKQKLWAAVQLAHGCFLELERTREEAMCHSSSSSSAAGKRAEGLIGLGWDSVSLISRIETLWMAARKPERLPVSVRVPQSTHLLCNVHVKRGLLSSDQRRDA